MKTTVIYDSDCGLCTRVKESVQALDWLGTMRWIPLSGEEAARYGIPRQELERSVYLVSESNRTHGWRAVKQIVARLPIVYLAAGVAIRKSRWAALGLGIVFSPLFDPAGERLYQLVARNRHRLPAATCAAPIWDNGDK